MCKYDVIYKTGSTRSRPPVACTFGEDWTCGFGDMLANRQTDTQNLHTNKQTNVPITILYSPTRGDGIIR